MLHEVDLFDGLAESDIDEIEKHAVEKRYRKNTVVIEFGHEANTLYVLTKGRVKVYRSDSDGKEVILRELGPGSYFGELALLGNQPRTASVMTLEESHFLLLSKRSFEQCLKNHPSIAFNLIRQLAQRVRSLTESVSDLALGDVYRRLAKFLSEVASDEEGRRVTPPYTHQELAARVGSCREMVTKILTDLKDGGYVMAEGRRLVLLRRLPARH